MLERGDELARSLGAARRWSIEFVPPAARTRGVRIAALVGRSEPGGALVAAADSEGFVACLEARGEEGAHRPGVRWTRHLGEPLRDAHLAFVGDRLSITHAAGFRLFDLADGVELSRLDDPGIAGPGRGFAGEVLVGRRDGRLWYALDARTGREWFAEPFAMERVAAPVVVTGDAPRFVVAVDLPRGRLEAFGAAAFRASPRGAPTWFADLGTSVVLTPLALSDPGGRALLLVALEGGGLCALEGERGTTAWRAEVGALRVREVTALGPFVTVASERETQVRHAASGTLWTTVSGWAVPFAWTASTLWVERGHVALALGPGAEPSTPDVERVPLPGAPGSLRLAPVLGDGRAVLYATTSGEIGLVDFQE